MAILDFLKKKKTKAKSPKEEVASSATHRRGGKKTKAKSPKEEVASSATEEKKVPTAAVPKKVKKTAAKKETKEVVKEAVSGGKGVYSNILLSPRITEKATELTEQNVYAFDVGLKSTKTEIKKAIQEVYNVNPVKIRIVQVPSKVVPVRAARGKWGTKSGGKKAYVQLKEGESIEFV